MTADCYFARGKTHTVCEDYALTDGFGFAVVSDGCSSSDYTDWGARFLCRAAQLTWDRVGEPRVSQIIGRADYMRYGADLPQTALDATLLVAWRNIEGVDVAAWGDGVIAARRRGTSIWNFIEIKYAYNAPAYPNYLLDPDRMEMFLTETGALREVAIYEGFGGDLSWTIDNREGYPHEGDTFSFPRDEFDLVLIISDGIQSFRQKDGRDMPPLDASDVLRLLLDFKGIEGQFVTRQVKWLLNKHCAAEGWHHNDDLAVAGIPMRE